MDSIDRIKQLNEQREEEAMKVARHTDLLDSDAQTQEIILRSFKTLVEFLSRHVSKTEVVNQLRSIGTPDVLELIPHIESLHETLKTHENVDLSEITSVMQAVLDETKKIPKELPELKEKEDRDYTAQFQGLQDAIQGVEQVVKAQKLIAEAPIVNVPETTVNVEKPDLKPLSDGLSNVVKAVKAIVIPEYKTDNKEVEKLLKKTNKTLEEILDKPVGGGGGGGSSWVAINQEGIAQPITLTADGKVPVDAAFSGTVEGAASFSDSSNVDKKALVDADRHVQVDVLTMPSITVDPPTGGATEAAQDAQTALLTTIEANQLPDGHNVTVDNASIAVTGTVTANTGLSQPLTDTQLRATPVPVDLGANNDVTVSGTVTANLSATDNAVLDQIELNQDAQTSLLTTIEANQLPDGHNVTVDNASIAVTGTFWQATQPVSLASVPSHNVTNAGTFAVQNTAATPAGTNAIGKLTQPDTPTLSNVTMTGSSVTLQASNANRRNLMIFNDSGVTIYVKLGSTASATSFTVKLVDQAYYELPDPVYTGIVTALGASGVVRVTEVV